MRREKKRERILYKSCRRPKINVKNIKDSQSISFFIIHKCYHLIFSCKENFRYIYLIIRPSSIETLIGVDTKETINQQCNKRHAIVNKIDVSKYMTSK